MAKAAAAQTVETKELSFWVAENHYDDGIGDDVFYVCGAPSNEAEFSGEIDNALKFADEDSVNRLMESLSFASYEAVEHSMSV